MIAKTFFLKTLLFAFLMAITACDSKKLILSDAKKHDINDKSSENSLKFQRIKACGCDQQCVIANARFNGKPDEWYELEIPDYPATITFSLNRTLGFQRGGVTLTPTGIQINEPGSYRASFSAVVQNTDPDRTIVLPFFLSSFPYSPTDLETQVLGFATVESQAIAEITGSGLLTDVEANTLFSIFVTNGGSTLNFPIIVRSWDISIYKVCSGNTPAST